MLFRNKQLCTLLLELISSFMLCFRPVNARNKIMLEKKRTATNDSTAALIEVSNAN